MLRLIERTRLDLLIARAKELGVAAFVTKPFELEADGLLAIAIQHENDHLDGKLMIFFHRDIPGIIGAVVTLMGLLAFPALLKAGYDQKFSAGTSASRRSLYNLEPSK